MVKLILIRHGYSEANYAGTFTGHRNVDLTDIGYKQARVTAEYILANYNVDRIYSSDLKRAYNTAVPLADKIGMDIVTTSDFREINGGEFEGLTFDKLLEKPEYQVFRNDPGNCAFPGGETMRQVEVRVMSKLREIVNQNDKKTVVITTHGGPLRVIKTVCKYGNLDYMKKVKIVPNSSITVIEAENGVFSLKVDGFDKHLVELHTEFSSKLV